MLLCTVYGAPLRWNKASELQCVAISCPSNRLTQNTTQDLLQRCRDPDKMIDFLALVTLMGHFDGCSWIYEKPFQSESHYLNIKCFIDVCAGALLGLNISITCTQQFNHFDC